MKTLVKLIALLFFLSFAIESTSQVSYAIKAGPNFANMTFSDNTDESLDDFKMVTGFHAGATIDIPVSKLLSIETGLLFSTKGTQVDLSESFEGQTIKLEVKVSTFYFDIPISLKANFPIGKTTLFVAAGPYIGIALNGTINSELTFDGQTESDQEDIEWGNDPENDMMKRFDFGLVPSAGIEFNSFALSVSYWWGLANISSYTDDEACIKNQNLQVTLAFILGNNAE